jgi:hypothetical protein
MYMGLDKGRKEDVDMDIDIDMDVDVDADMDLGDYQHRKICWPYLISNIGCLIQYQKIYRTKGLLF